MTTVYWGATSAEKQKHNGVPYENTENDWTYLGNAGKYARYLGFIDPAASVDRRNPNPQLFVVQSSLVHPWWDF